MEDNRPLLTREGAERLRTELYRMEREERHDIAKTIGIAREFGDLKENAEYHSAKDKQGMLEARIKDLKGMLSHAEVIDVASLPEDGKARFGSHVTLRDLDSGRELRLHIVGDMEADASAGRVSYRAPLAASLLGHAQGEFIDVDTGSSATSYEILAVTR